MTLVGMERRFAQVDVFAPHALTGNPLAVVVDGDGLSDDEMQQFAKANDDLDVAPAAFSLVAKACDAIGDPAEAIAAYHRVRNHKLASQFNKTKALTEIASLSTWP